MLMPAFPARVAPAPRSAAAHLDGTLNAVMSRWTGGLAPNSLALAATDWWLHGITQPAASATLVFDAWQRALACAMQDLQPGGALCDGEDLRFSHPTWREWPYASVARRYLAAEAWWKQATELRGMNAHHRDIVRMSARQWLDLLSPANFGLLNPEVLERTLATGGANLAQGVANAVDDWRQRRGLPPLQESDHPYRPGVDLALTPGQVVYRNALVELIQYAPQTPQVQAEPVFIVPSWIMKYYILDLSPHNSMVRWLVGRGHTVFILSWKNPDEGDARLGMADYLELGVFQPLAEIARRIPATPVHGVGYCLGGTLLAIAAAALARPGAVQAASRLPALASVSLLAAETDFTEPGEMGVLIDESQVAMLEDLMAERGFLSGRQMAGSFQFLHARELIWSATLREIWMGERLRPSDLMAWNADTTRMPAAMHSEYLRRCYLRNEIAESRYPVEGRTVSLADLRLPIFLVGTEKDHVSPWRSVYKLHRLTDVELTFVLTNGGHNAGIVTEPGHPGRHYAQHTRQPGDPWIDPDQWAAIAERHEGSWWEAWQAWLVAHGDGRTVPARDIEAPVLDDAPGRYVHLRYPD
jgi:polyhydroxyalkanoate synthase